MLLAVTGCDLQNSMLYYPNKEKPSQDYLIASGIRFWGEASGDYRGYVSALPGSKHKATIIVFHGNAGAAADRVYYMQALAGLGYRVVLAEYPGYGGRKGKPGEAVFVADARETVRLAFEQFREPIVLLGESLGCGVVAAAVRNAPAPVSGLILITPWDTLLAVAREHFPWLPVRLLLRDTYDSVGNLNAFRERIAVVGAEQDDIVPVRHARALYQSLPGEKRIWTIAGAGHNDWFDAVGPEWWKEITDYIMKEGKP